MQRNSIKIISDPVGRTVSYHIKNEADAWVHVARSSPLSRKEYTETSIRESAEKIIEAIDDTYNTGNRGVDLEIKCTDDEFTYLSELIAKNYDNINILGTQKEPTRQPETSDVKEDIVKTSAHIEKNYADYKVSGSQKEPAKQPEGPNVKEDIVKVGAQIEKHYPDYRVLSVQKELAKQPERPTVKEGVEKVGVQIEKHYPDYRVLSVQKEPAKQPERPDVKEDIVKVGKKETKQNADIVYRQNKMHVAFAGKIASGKTTLMVALADLKHIIFKVSNEDGYDLYQNMEKGQLWYEIAGIDIGKTYVDKAKTTIRRLIDAGMDVLIYCFSTDRIEDAEKNILCSIKNDFPNVRILAVLTSCTDENSTVFAERMSNHLNGIKALPVLAKDKKTRGGIVSAYGIEDISKFIYGGK